MTDEIRYERFVRGVLDQFSSDETFLLGFSGVKHIDRIAVAFENRGCEVERSLERAQIKVKVMASFI